MIGIVGNVTFRCFPRFFHVFGALRLLGYDNVKVLQDGIEGWKAKGGFDAHARASKPAGH